ncbi:MAG: hypothetical protein M3295_10535 [Chloroflexota bacterium]|nr:hypothetical protein [Chloroflexota bacterium]
MRFPGALSSALLCLALVACTEESPSPTIPSVPPSATVAVTPTAVPATPTAEPTPLPLALPEVEKQSTASVDYRFSPNLPPDGEGELLVIVTNTSDEDIAELALRWPTALNEVLYLAPFTPSPDRMVNPLVQPWTRWVEGPGTRGEPAGTTTLGYGPLDAGETLQIPLVAQWREPREVEFDVEFLDREAQLQLTSGGPAHVRVRTAPT